MRGVKVFFFIVTGRNTQSEETTVFCYKLYNKSNNTNTVASFLYNRTANRPNYHIRNYVLNHKEPVYRIVQCLGYRGLILSKAKRLPSPYSPDKLCGKRASYESGTGLAGSEAKQSPIYIIPRLETRGVMPPLLHTPI